MSSIDEQSHSFLLDTAGEEKFYNWVVETTRPFIQGRSIEVNSGAGIFSNILARHQIPIHLSDPTIHNRETLRSKFAEVMYVRAVHNIDAYTSNISVAKPELVGVFDTLFAVNVLQYGYFTHSAIRNFQSLLQPQGHLIIIAPVFNAIYAGLEQNPATWKAFNKKALIKLLNNQFVTLRLRYINLIPVNFAPSLGLSTLAILKKNSYG